MRAGATSRMSCPWVFLLKGTKAPTPENEERSRDFLVCKVVTTWRPCACNLARNAVAMPPPSTILRASWLFPACCSSRSRTTQTPDQSAREKHVTVDGLTMPIDIAGQRMGLGCVFCESLWGMPELGAPTCKSRREAVCAIGIGYLRQKCLGVPIAVGPLPSGEQGQAVRRVATQVPRAR